MMDLRSQRGIYTDQALQAHHLTKSGFSVIPIRTDGSKRPASTWKRYQTDIAGKKTLDRWFGKANKGIGIICGHISGNLEVLDFDSTSVQTEPLDKIFEKLVKGYPGGEELLKKLVKVQTPGKRWAKKGYQYLYRCDQAVAGGQKLARGSHWDEKQQKWTSGVLIETRGEGNYIIVPGSPPETHPRKKEYKFVRGDLTSIPKITKQEYQILFACARALDQWEVSEHNPKNQQQESEEGCSFDPKSNLPGDVFNREASWESLLCPHGYRIKGKYFCRPGKAGQEGHSGTINYDGTNRIYVFSTNDQLEAGRYYTKFQAHAFLNHDGNFKAAAADLAAKGFGELSKDKNGVPYQATSTGLLYLKPTKNGPVPVTLTNFTARICTDVIEDDGAETRHTFEMEAKLNGQTYRFTIPASRFKGLQWVTEELGARAVVYPYSGRERTPAAIQLLTEDIDERRTFIHTGWRKLAEQWVYLHAGGAIGPIGPIPEVGVQLEGTLTHYHLPEPTSGEEQVKAIQSSLRFLDSAPDRVTVPLYGGIWRVVLGNVDFSEHIAGPTGKGKSEVAALAQQHFGSQMDARNLPANWTSTDNALEGFAFLAKDAVLVIDDFAPAGTSFDIARLHQKADRVMRAQGNRSGRQRMRSDSTLQTARPPRGLIVSTGEDVPRGKSLRARMFVIEVSPGDVDWEKLTTCQEDAANGVYAQAMAGFIQWLAPRYESIREQLPEEIRTLRKEASQSGMHKRTPDIVANLAVGLRYFLKFAQEVGAITKEERQALWKRMWKSLGEVASAQEKHLAASDPVDRFLELVRAAISSGQAHIAGPDGHEPQTEGWGWRQESDRDNPQGTRIGWLDGDNLYLEPEASFNVAQRLARESGEPLSVGSKTLHKRLDERHLLVSKEREDRLVVRKTLEGKRRPVLHLNKSTLFPPKPDQPDQTDQKEAQNIDR